MLPFSFAEYFSASQSEESVARLYGRYISQGSFPAVVDLGQDSLALHDYLEGILNTVLFKDVAQRLNIANTLGLGSLVDFMFDNIGNLVSVKSIADTLTSNGTKISRNTVAEYLSALANSYILYPAKCFDVRGKRLLKLQQKFYAVDMGMRRMLLSNQVRDTGRILENIVFLELKRRFASVYVGRVGELEIDFVVEGSDGTAYFQVAESVANEKVLECELAPLRKIGDNYPKYLLTLDDSDPVDYEGVTRINALDWMLEA